MIFCVKKRCKNSYEKCKFLGRCYRDYDKIVFQNALLRCDWSEFYLTKDPEYAWRILFLYILYFADYFCPLRHFYIRKDVPKWFNKDLIEMSHFRDSLFKEFQRFKDPTKLNEARRVRNLVKTSLGQAKNLYFLNELDKKSDDPIKFWRDMDMLTNRNKKGS